MALGAYAMFFEAYPDSRMIGFAALQLGRLHAEQRRPMAATAYLFWLMDYEATMGYEYTSPETNIETLLERAGGCRQ